MFVARSADMSEFRFYDLGSLKKELRLDKQGIDQFRNVWSTMDKEMSTIYDVDAIAAAADDMIEEPYFVFKDER